MSKENSFNSYEFVHEAALDPNFIRPILPPTLTFTIPTGPTGNTGPTGFTGPIGLLAYSFSEPISIFMDPPPLTVGNVETSITTIAINIPQNALIELRGLVNWNTRYSNVLVFWRIRRGIGGPIIWEGHDGVVVVDADQLGCISNMLHVDTSPLLGNNIYQLTAQVDPIISPFRSANITEPIVFSATAYPS